MRCIASQHCDEYTHRHKPSPSINVQTTAVPRELLVPLPIHPPRHSSEAAAVLSLPTANWFPLRCTVMGMEPQPTLFCGGPPTLGAVFARCVSAVRVSGVLLFCCRAVFHCRNTPVFVYLFS